MTDRHKEPPMPFRPAEGYRAWLKEHARKTGKSVNAVLRQAVAEFRERHEGDLSDTDRFLAH